MDALSAAGLRVTLDPDNEFESTESDVTLV